MARSREQHISRIVTAVENGDLSAIRGVEEATGYGQYLAIGKAATSRYNHPMQTISGETGNETLSVLRAGKVGMTAVLYAFGNGLYLPLSTGTQHAEYQDKTKFDWWTYDQTIEDYMPTVPRALLDTTDTLPDGTVIGAVDFVDNTNFTIRIPNEPGHFASLEAHETRATMPVGMRDAREVLTSTAL